MALVVVMLVIVVLSVLAAGFAYSMKVETRLARNVSSEPEMLWLARSGVELARYVLAQQLGCLEEPYDALNQKWANGHGGACGLEGALGEVSLDDVALGPGRVSIQVLDLERKLNINLVSRDILQRALELLGVDALGSTELLAALEDWRDPNQMSQLGGGAESAYYLSLPQPYIAKDGPIDDLSELLLIKGMRPELYWGAERDRDGATSVQRDPAITGQHYGDPLAKGFIDLFNTLGRPQVNLNTASPEVLQLLPGMDHTLASGIVQLRAGLDGVDGTEDDTPLRNPGELINVRGMFPEQVQALQRFCGVRSFTFEARVRVVLGGYQRTYTAILYRNGPRDVQILAAYWE